jgi:hypothetical protein
MILFSRAFVRERMTTLATTVSFAATSCALLSRAALQG